MTRTAPASRALIRNHPADVALAARHVDLYDRPLTRAGSGTAHKARGTSARITDDGMAAFLAATAR